MTLILKTVAFLLVVPGTVAAAVPFALVLMSSNGLPLELGNWRYAGVLLMVIGAVVYVRCTIDLVRFGQGIPAPSAPTRFLVRNALYRYMRNPMYVAAAVFLFGEAVAASRGILFIYAAAVTACYYPAVVYLEEPALRRRFGEDFDRYCAQVPRWLPRLTSQS
jgi:protein-S-isoprenylcysteine O-methyltransferase Ste14